MKTILLNISILLYSLVPPVTITRQDGPGEVIYRVHSIYIYNFIKEIQWPDTYNNNNIVIGVLGNTEMEIELKKMATARTTSSRKITVKLFKNASEVEKTCHILYLAAEHSDGLSTVLQKVKGSSMLVITNKDGAAKFGSLINFVSEGGKPRFEMNLSAFEKSHLKYTQQLKTVAITVN
ncbi:YfiR family protein [Xanthocytophaga agilis]|uniref:YfiR family protein n=1 Tax=Xanthocytophaga agilis TaxID=3048010 RepID=A0AAE3RBV1_9BACT|nr:YfiR family protein [Xanthocytophaga agilis]MDJ1504623.1 YfiR family protein [Xanthocytophaga agilis]